MQKQKANEVSAKTPVTENNNAQIEENVKTEEQQKSDALKEDNTTKLQTEDSNLNQKTDGNINKLNVENSKTKVEQTEEDNENVIIKNIKNKSSSSTTKKVSGTKSVKKEAKIPSKAPKK